MTEFLYYLPKWSLLQTTSSEWDFEQKFKKKNHTFILIKPIPLTIHVLLIKILYVILTIKQLHERKPKEIVEPRYLRIYTNFLLKLGREQGKIKQRCLIHFEVWGEAIKETEFKCFLMFELKVEIFSFWANQANSINVKIQGKIICHFRLYCHWLDFNLPGLKRSKINENLCHTFLGTFG